MIYRHTYLPEPNPVVRSLCILLVVLTADALSTAMAGNAEYLCGSRTYFPPQTAVTAFVEDPDLISAVSLELSTQVTVTGEQLVREIQKPIKRRFIMNAADVAKAKGGIIFRKSGLLNIMDLANNKYYFLPHKENQKISVVGVKPQGDNVAVELLYLPAESNFKEPVAMNVDQNTTTFPPGTKISIATEHLRKFDFTLTEGEYFYQAVDPGHRAKLEIDTLRTSPRGTFTVQVRDLHTDFSRRAFVACARPSNPELGREYHQITDIEILEAKVGEARLALSLPESMHDIQGFNYGTFSTPIELRILSTKGESQAQDAEVILAEQRYFVGSPMRSRVIAFIITFLAYLLPLWFIRAQRRATSTSAGVNFGLFTVIKNSSVPMMGSEVTERASLKATPPAWFSPLWLGRSRRGAASLSSFQITTWTYLVFFVATYVFLLNGQLIDIPNQILILLGISGAGSVAAKVTAKRQDERAELITAARSGEGKGELLKKQAIPSWCDLIMTGGQVELARLQMLVFTILAAAYVGITAMITFKFPVVPEGLLWLMGISNGLYVLGKTAEPGLADRLAQVDFQRRAAVRDKEIKENRVAAITADVEKKKDELKQLEGELKQVQGDAEKKEKQTQIDEKNNEIKKLQDGLNIATKALEDAKKEETNMEDKYKEILQKLNQALEKESGATT